MAPGVNPTYHDSIGELSPIQGRGYVIMVWSLAAGSQIDSTTNSRIEDLLSSIRRYMCFELDRSWGGRSTGVLDPAIEM